MRVFSFVLMLLLVVACGEKERSPLETYPRTETAVDREAAAYSGNTEAQYDYAKRFCCTVDGYYDIVQASKWLCKAARKSHPMAQFEIASIYDGRPVMHNRSIRELATSRIYIPESLTLAYAWYSLAAQNGVKAAEARLRDLVLEVSVGQLERAKQLMHYVPSIPCEISHQPEML